MELRSASIEATGASDATEVIEASEATGLEPPTARSVPTWPALAEICAAVGDPLLTRAAASYEAWAEEEFLSSHDHFSLVGEDNFRRYLPLPTLRIRVEEGDSLFDIFARALAARAAGRRMTVSVAENLTEQTAAHVERLDALTDDWAASIEFVRESVDQLAEGMLRGSVDRIRFARPERVAPQLRVAAAQALQYLADAPVSSLGRLELLWYFQEQSLSHSYHRYGNLGERAAEQRAPLR